jgi:hypothetical protein
MIAGRSGGSYQTDWAVLLYRRSSQTLIVNGLQANARSTVSLILMFGECETSQQLSSW